MGKTRKHKIRNTAKSNPLGALKLDDNDEGFAFGDEMEQSEGSPIEAIRDQLLNVNIEEKLNGLQSFAVLTGSKDKVVAICRSDVIRIAAPLLCEREQQPVRNAAAGALRNLSVCGAEVCEFMVEQDVLTPLLVLLSEYTMDVQWTPTFDATMRDQIDLRSDIFLQAINLLWNLCESTAVALDTFNQTQMLEGFMRYLDFKIFGLEISISVAQCLLVVSENNPKAWNVLSQNVQALLHLCSVGEAPTSEQHPEHGHTYLRTLAAGILSNVPALAAAYAKNILTSLAQTLENDHQVTLSSLTRLLLPEQAQQNGAAPELEVNMDAMDTETEEAATLRRRRQELPSDADLAVRNVGNLLDAQRVAAEVITNLCSSDEEEWVDAEDDDISEGEGVTDYENTKNDTSLNDEDKLPVEMVEVIKSMGLIEKLWQRAQPISGNMVQILRESSRISLLMKAKNLRISSLLCLQNLCNTLCSEDLGGPTALYGVWVDLGQQVFKGPQDLSILEPSTSLMRSALDHLKPNKELFNQMTKSDLELMLDGVKNCTMAEIRANWLRMLGTLGCLLPEELVKMIISFILATCAQEEDVWTISEALDALMDMFSDNDWNQIIVDLNLPILIKQLEKTFKSKIRQQRRELKERYPAVQTVRTNFSRFVGYIESEATKYANGTGH